MLDDLQDLGFVTRRMDEHTPIATYPGLTEKGLSLCPVFDEIKAWVDDWLDENELTADT